jgi:tRNA (mo5U34)-methyltransferase
MSAVGSTRREDIQARVRELGPWFHNIDLHGVPTAPEHFLGDYPAVKWKRFQSAIPANLAGKTVLDIGCNAGFYSLEMKRRGASRVVGIDDSETYLAQARFAAEMLGQDIDYRRLSAYDVAELAEQFDLVLYMGVFYHLRHPLLALDLIYEHAARDLMLFQSMQRGSKYLPELAQDYDFFDESPFESRSAPLMYFIEHAYSHDSSNWWIPNRAGVEAMLRSSGFEIIDQPEDEVYLCRRGQIPDSHERAVYPARGVSHAG